MAADIRYEPVQASDFESLLALRLEALRDSLTRLSRWNPEFSRRHFQGVFEPEHMQHIVVDGQRVGFVMVVPEGNALRLKQLYLNAATRGRGIGGEVLRSLQTRAAHACQAVVLEALQQSEANRFYQRHGFVQTAATELDVAYRWTPAAHGVAA